jgi:hypothetical protein
MKAGELYTVTAGSLFLPAVGYIALTQFTGLKKEIIWLILIVLIFAGLAIASNQIDD